MTKLRADDPLAVAATEAIRNGEVEQLHQLIIAHPELVTAQLTDPGCEDAEVSRTLLGVVTDWPGHLPNGAASVALLAEAGADLQAAFHGPHSETPLHGAASSNDIEVLDALLDAGADIEAPGAVIAGGTPLDDAVAFAQWRSASRLAERGAQTALWHAAALGLLDRVRGHFEGKPLVGRYPWGVRADGSSPDEVTVALWCACHGGQRQCAEHLLEHDAEINWVSGWDGLTPLDAAVRGSEGPAADWPAAAMPDFAGLIAWLRHQGAESASQRE